MDVREFTGGPDLIKLYFNDTDNKAAIMKALHVENTTKSLNNYWESDSQVYDSLANTNDIYGKNSTNLITQISSKIPVLIMEGAYDTLDGVLAL